MCVRDRLVLKLPRREVDAAVSSKRGERLSMGRGRVMKEWLAVSTEGRGWTELARLARAFVAGEA